MSKTREIACKYYINEKNCGKGREGTFYHQCQHCDLYEPVRHGIPARKDLHKEKRYKAEADRRNWEE